MALKVRDQVKIQLGATVLQLKADPGESFLVKGIKIYSAAGTYATLKTEKTTVGYFRIDETYGNHLAFSQIKDSAIALAPHLPFNLLDLLWNLGIFKGYPIAEGETFVLSGAEGAGDIKVVVYDIYDAEDQKNTAPNGSKALEYMLINYGDTGAAIAAAGDNRYDNPLNPVEFPQFPYAADVPAKTQISIHGILGSEVGVRDATPATAIYTRYLKLVKDREVLFDEDRNGLPFDFSTVSGAAGTKAAGGHSWIGNYTHVDPRMPLIFADPLLFDAGDELNIYATTVEPVDGSTIAVAYQVLAMIETIKRVQAA
jgi:hypothetical protein